MVLSDYEKIVMIAQTYSFIHGEFSSRNIVNFVISHNFNFKSNGITARVVTSYLNKSKKFYKVCKKNNATYYKAFDK